MSSIPPLEQLARWPARAAAGWYGPAGAECAGPVDEVFPWASVTKVITSMAVWLAIEEQTVAWDDAVGPPGATLAHLLAHASGLAPDSDEALTAPGKRRIYSNRGIELAAEHVAGRAGMAFADYLCEGVLRPLGLSATRLEGSPASGAAGSLEDLLAVGRELMAPSLISRTTVDLVTAVAFPGLAGILPGFGHHPHNDWGLGVEIRDEKRPHWTGSRNSPSTFGHFGQSGAFLWVDRGHRTIAASVSDRPFGPWAAQAWPAFSDSVIEASRL